MVSLQLHYPGSHTSSIRSIIKILASIKSMHPGFILPSERVYYKMTHPEVGHFIENHGIFPLQNTLYRMHQNDPQGSMVYRGNSQGYIEILQQFWKPLGSSWDNVSTQGYPSCRLLCFLGVQSPFFSLPLSQFVLGTPRLRGFDGLSAVNSGTCGTSFPTIDGPPSTR